MVLLAGGKLLYAHLDTAFTSHTGYCCAGMSHLHPHRRWQTKAHGAQPAGINPTPWLIKFVILRGPHLVLTHVGSHKRFAMGDFIQLLHHKLWLDHLDGAFVCQRFTRTPFFNPAIVLVAMFCGACSSTKETKSGYKYNLVREGDGVVPASGQILVLTMVFKDSKDSVWSDSRKGDFPTMVQRQDTVPQGDVVLEVFQTLTKGDSVTFQVAGKELFEKTFKSLPPPGVDPVGLFTFQIGVTDVISEEDAQKLQSDMMAKMNEKETIKQQAQLAIDTALIVSHLKEKSISAQQTASGIRYVVVKQGKGNMPTQGQTVKINYTGFLLDGRCFDSSIESVAKANNVFSEQRRPYEPLEVVLGYRQVIAGWEEVISLMNKGAKMTVYIPSGLAYGLQGRGELIRENAVLKFDMELLEIK